VYFKTKILIRGWWQNIRTGSYFKPFGEVPPSSSIYPFLLRMINILKSATSDLNRASLVYKTSAVNLAGSWR